MHGVDSLFAKLLAILALAAVFALLVLAVRLCAQDAKRRGKSPALVVIACIFFFPLGLFAWLLFRPAPMDRRRLRGFRPERRQV
jgi:hypothetical protein